MHRLFTRILIERILLRKGTDDGYLLEVFGEKSRGVFDGILLYFNKYFDGEGADVFRERRGDVGRRVGVVMGVLSGR